MNLGSPAPRSVRMELRNPAGKMKSAKLAPILATPFMAGESGLVQQQLSITLDPVAGRMISQTFAKVTQVFVPVQAVHALRYGHEKETAGITEVIRRDMKDGKVLFSLENEGQLTKRMAINPKSIAGQKRVSSIARIAHNAAVNHLRKRRYIYADLLKETSAIVTPAIIDETVLDRFGGALDPDDHVNGQVDLEFGAIAAPVRGISQDTNYNSPSSSAADVKIVANNTSLRIGLYNDGTHVFGQPQITFARKEGNPEGTELDIYADLEAISAGGVSLVDFYNAQKADELVRKMRRVADQNPEDGEDAVLRWAFGLSADNARHPWVVYENRFPLREVGQAATDAQGILDEVLVTQQSNNITWSVPIPQTELGGILITFLQVTPDEVLNSMPHPILTDAWSAVNHAAETLRLDPEPATFRDLFADVATQSDETQVKFYTGANALKRTYVDYGFNRQVDPSTVDAKTVIWQYAIPAGVTPQNILYPENFSQYPFLDQNAEVVTYNLSSVARISTPMFFGPTPVEKVAIVDEKEILG